VGGLRKHELLPKSTPFFPNMILELYVTKLDETWTQGLPQHKDKFSKEVFSNPKIPLLIVDELKQLGFGGEIHEIEGARAMDSLQG
jgi:hypothetical protein